MHTAHRTALGVAALLAALAWPLAAGAQADGFDVDLFRPLPGGRTNHELVRTARGPGRRAVSVGIVGSSRSGLLAAEAGNGRDEIDLLSSRSTATLVLGYGITDWLHVALDAPLYVTQEGAADVGGPLQDLDLDAGFGPGDPRLSLGLSLLSESPVQLGMAVDVWLPVGEPDALQGDALRAAPHLLIDVLAGARTRLSFNVGWAFRPHAEFGAADIDDAVLYGVAAEIALVPDLLYIVPELAGAAMLQADVLNTEELPLLGVLGLEAQLAGGTTLGGGVSTGLVRGVGTHDLGASLRIEHTFGGGGGGGGGGAPRDRDGDGVPNADDLCRTEPEDIDGFDDFDGCPDVDNDADGILDADDACPGDAEDVDGFDDGDGCPDLDNDGDGVLDSADLCPNESPETRNGYHDEDGCPDTPAAGLPLVCRLIPIAEPVLFRSGRDRILEASFPVLDAVAQELEANPDILRVRVEGHTDSVGSTQANLDISQQRAEAVVAWLVDWGIDAERLEAVGYGEGQPIADNDTSDGRAANRRVVFTVVERVGCGE